MNPSIYVVSAMAGNFRGESHCNPQLWESFVVRDWSDMFEIIGGDGTGGYGLGQWTNTDDDIYMRLLNLHNWVTSNGYADGDAEGQVAYLLEERWWKGLPHQEGFDEFIQSTDTDLYDLTRRWLVDWEGIGTSDLSRRYGYALECYAHILEHANDNPQDYQWVVGNRWLSIDEQLNNTMCLWFALQGYVPPTPPSPTGKKKMPIWMMIRRF